MNIRKRHVECGHDMFYADTTFLTRTRNVVSLRIKSVHRWDITCDVRIGICTICEVRVMSGLIVMSE